MEQSPKKRAPKRNRSLRTEQKFDSEDLICGCVGFSLADLNELVAKDPDMRFEDLMAQSGAGTTCTACMLSLEYHFTNSSRPNAGSQSSKKVKHQAASTMSLKYRLYDFLDRYSPMLPAHLVNTVPIFRSDSLSTHIRIANDAMFYDPEHEVHEGTVIFTVRNADGKTLGKESLPFSDTSPVYFDASRFLDLPDGKNSDIPLEVGSIDIRRVWKTPTVRGTSRPQIIVEGKNGCGGVHSQGPQGAGEAWYSTIHRPGDVKTFIAYCNCDRRPIDVELTFPLMDKSLGADQITKIRERIPRRGTRLFEISVPEETAAKMPYPVFDVCCSANGLNKAIILDTSPDLDQISLDHPASG